MKKYRLTIACLAALTTCVVTGCSKQEQKDAADTAEKSLDKAGNAATKALDSASERVSDISITGAVKTKLAATKDISANDIDVTTVNNVVTLEGKVATPALKNLAGQLAKTTPGVKAVSNKLVVGR